MRNFGSRSIIKLSWKPASDRSAYVIDHCESTARYDNTGVVVNDESKHSTFSRINIVICFIPCGGPTVICFIPCGSRAADPLDGHRNVTGRYTFS
ncbi:hypothetical protein J6590_088127 [Homalodisca vitripennis]|nr:hypothetical protein J6590_088127 [Homalodisca vitripennis]